MSANSAVLLTLTRERYAQKTTNINITVYDETKEISSAMAEAVGDTVEISGKSAEISDAELEVWAKTAPEIAEATTFALEETGAEVSKADAESKIKVDGSKNDTPQKTVQETKISDMSESQQTNIKTTIWRLHHPTPGAGGSEGGGSEGGGDGDDGGGDDGGEEGGGEETPSSKTTFIKASYNSFNDTTTMFNYISSVDSSVTTSTGITRSQLVALTQNDNKEDENADFFGSINRLFYTLDTNSDGKLSFAEIQAFIGDEIGTEAAFKSKVESYSQALETSYRAMTNEQKVDFALARTQEYLDAAGLTLQSQALARLLTMENYDTSAIHRGNISFTYVNEWDLNHDYRINNETEAQKYYEIYGEMPTYLGPGRYTDYFITNGCYTSYSYEDTWSNELSDDNRVNIWVSDNDKYYSSHPDSILGITLDMKYLNDPNCSWVELVDVLVHELTHATMPLYYVENKDAVLKSNAIDMLDQYTNIDNATINALKAHWNSWQGKTLKDLGVTQADINLMQSGSDPILLTYEANNWKTLKLNELSYYSLLGIYKDYNFISDEDWEMRIRLFYLITAACGEYVAYQTDADYLDSVAGDIYNSSEVTASNGPSEKGDIITHVQSGYDNADGDEARPEWEWKTYVA